MWNRFTEQARRIVFFAQEDAVRLGHNEVGTEHLLLSLIRAKDTVATRILVRMNISLEQIKSETERQAIQGEDVKAGDMRLTLQSQKVVEFAYEEASRINNKYIGTEHLLLGLIREPDGLARRVLDDLGVDLELTRSQVEALQDSDSGIPPRQKPSPEHADTSPTMSTEKSVEKLENVEKLTDKSSSILKEVPTSKVAPDKWQRFSERAMRVVSFAQEEAGRLGWNDVATEHLMLGLLRENDSVAARVLINMGISLGALRSEIERHAPRGEGRPGQEMPMLTPAAKRVVDMTYDEARLLNHQTEIGTEHLLLGLIREREGLASLVLAEQGVDLESTRQEVKSLQESESAQAPDQTPTPEGSSPPMSTEKIVEKLENEEKLTEKMKSFQKEAPDRKADKEMWQRFTERARRVVFFAQEEAGRLGENYVSTEHLLLGLVRENDSVAARILDRMGVSLGRIRSEIERQVTRGDGRLGQDMQLTPRAKRVIDLAYDEARLLFNNYIGTEHLLMGLLRENEGLAGRVLAKLGVELERTRNEVKTLQDNDSGASSNPKTSSRSSMPSTTMDPQQEALEREVLRLKTQSKVYEALGRIHGEVPLNAILDRSHLWYKQNLLGMGTVSSTQFFLVLETARMLKSLHHSRSDALCFSYPATMALLFEKPSLRTRTSFEAGMAQLRGHAVYLAPGDVGLGTRESVADVAGGLSRWVDLIAARVFKHETVAELAENATIPVINALSDREHPLQMFADMLTILEHTGKLDHTLKIAYVGDGNNVLHSLLLTCARINVTLSVACPEGYGPDPWFVNEAQRIAGDANLARTIQFVLVPKLEERSTSEGDVTIPPDIAAAVENADVVYTDVWTSMGQEAEAEERRGVFAPFQVNSSLLALAKPDAIVLHCLPAHRGEEITAEVMETHKQVILDQAENRLHTQKALLMLILGL